MSAQPTQMSYCVVCDAEPGECAHTGARYLAPLAYEKVQGDSPTTWIWRRPASEVWRAANPQSSWPRPAPAPRATEEALPLEHLLIRLEDHMEVDYDLGELLREGYAHDPLKTSRLVAMICDKTASRALRSPGGLLVSRLRKLLHP